jgi:hypothetical protein
MKWLAHAGLFAFRVALIVSLLLIAIGAAPRDVSVKAIPDAKHGTVCYVTNHGGISCVADGRRL